MGIFVPRSDSFCRGGYVPGVELSVNTWKRGSANPVSGYLDGCFR